MEGMQQAVSAGGKVYWPEYAQDRGPLIGAFLEKCRRGNDATGAPLA
jgi:hypothetical protein